MSIVRNSAWNVIGIVIPSLIAIPTLAIYSRALGVELLGLLTLTFAIVGYASSFDLGLSRALIRQVAIHSNDVGAIKVFMGTSTLFVAGISIVLSVIAWLGTDVLTQYLKVSSEAKADAIASFHWLSLLIPPYLLALVSTAYFEGLEDFKALSIIRCVTSLANAAAGVACVAWFGSLASVLAALCVTRWLSCLATFELYRWHVNGRDDVARPALWVFRMEALLSSLRYGGWLTVSNVVGPVMVYFDRFVLSHLAGAQLVAYYTVPAELVARLTMFPAAIARSLFPRLSKRHGNAMDDRRTGSRLTVLSCALTILPVFAFADWILRVWMGPEYQGQPATVLRILLVGFFFNALAFGPFTDLQARGHSKTTAMVHLAEVGPYVIALGVFTHWLGIVGTAIAWSVRTFVDYLLMEYLSRRTSEAV